MSPPPALIGCNLGVIWSQRFAVAGHLEPQSNSLPAVPVSAGWAKGRRELHCVVAAYAGQIESRSVAGPSRNQIGSAVRQRRQAVSAGCRGNRRLPGGERRGSCPAANRSEPKAASGGCRSWNDARTERKHERRELSDHG